LFASPQFLFRTELGPPETDGKTPITLTAFEKASSLSYFLTDGPPDGELLAAARAGALDVPAIETQARRLLTKSDTSLGLIQPSWARTSSSPWPRSSAASPTSAT